MNCRYFCRNICPWCIHLFAITRWSALHELMSYAWIKTVNSTSDYYKHFGAVQSEIRQRLISMLFRHHFQPLMTFTCNAINLIPGWVYSCGCVHVILYWISQVHTAGTHSQTPTPKCTCVDRNTHACMLVAFVFDMNTRLCMQPLIVHVLR